MADKKLSETENLSYDLSTPVYVAVVKYSSSEPSATVENRKIPLSDFAKASDLSNYATNTALTNAVNTLDAKFNNYPLDTAVVHNTGNETVAGNKSFTGTITATTQATSDNSTKVATTGYVKNSIGAASTVPTGTILSFGGTSVPTGYLRCNGAAVSRTTYSALFSVIGTTWGAGNGSTTFNLPKLNKRFLQDGTVGTYNSESLPNIKGGMTLAHVIANNFSGAFSETDGNAAYYGHDSSQKESIISFNAHNSNSVYQDNARVQPNNAEVMFIIKY